MLTKAATHLRPLIRLSHQNLPTDAFSSNPSIFQHLQNGSSPSSTSLAPQAGANPAGPSSFAGASGGGRQGYQGPFRSLLHLQTTNPAQPLSTSNTASDEDDSRLQSLRAHRPSQTPAKVQSAPSKTPAKSPTTRIVYLEEQMSIPQLEAAPSKRRGSITYPRVSRPKADLFTVGIGRAQRPATTARVYSTQVLPRASSSQLLVTVPAHSTPKPQTRVSATGRVRSQSTSAVEVDKPSFSSGDVVESTNRAVDMQFFEVLRQAIGANNRERIADLINRYRSTRDDSATPSRDIQVGDNTPPADVPLPQTYTLQTYNLCLTGLAHNRQSGDSIAPILEAYNEMLERDILPNGQTYSLVIQALCHREADIQDAVRRFEQEQKWSEWTASLTGQTETPHASFKSSKALSKDALDSYTHEGNFASALKLFRAAVGFHAKGFYLQHSVYVELLKTCAMRADTDAAVEVYAHAEQHKVGDPRTLLCHVIDAYGKKREVEGVDEVWKEFRQLADDGAFDEIEPRFQGDVPGYDLLRTRDMWVSALKAYILAGATPKAVELLQQIKAAHASDVEITEAQRSSASQPPPLTGATYRPVFEAFLAKGDLDAAIEFRQSHKDVVDIQSFLDVSLASHLIFAGRVDDALIPAKEMLAYRSATYDTAMFGRLATALSAKAIEARVAGDFDGEKLKLAQVKDVVAELSELQLFRLGNEGTVLLVKAFVDAGEFKDLATILCKLQPPRDDYFNHALEPYFTAVTTIPHLALVDRLACVNALARHKSPTPVKQLAELINRYREARAAVQSPKDFNLTPDQWKRMLLSFNAVGKAEEAPLDDIQSDLLAFVDDLATLDGNVSRGGVLSAYNIRNILFEVFGYVLFKHMGRERAIASLEKFLEAKVAEEFVNRADPQVDHTTPVVEFKMPPSPNTSNSSLPPTTPPMSPESDASKVRVDNKHSSRIDSHLMQHPPITALQAYHIVKDTYAKDHTVPHADAIGRLMQSLSRVGEEEKVRELYDLAQIILATTYADPLLQARSWFTVEDHMLISCCHFGLLEEAGLHRARIIEQGGVPSADAYASMISSAKDTTDDASVARELFDESQRLGVRPHLYLYNTIISKLSKARKAELALELFMHMKEAGIRPSSVTYGAVINACCRVGDSESAATLFNEMVNAPNFKPRVPPYNTMMQLYLWNHASRELVLHYYAAMQQARVPPSAHTYKLLLDAYGTLEPVDTAGMERVFAQLVADKKVKVQGTHWASVILAYGTGAKDVERAVQVFESIPSHRTTTSSQLDPVIWEALLNVYVTAGRVDDLTAGFEKMKQSGVRGTAYVYNALIAGNSAAGRIEQAREVFESMSDSPMGVAAPNNHPTLLTSSGQAKPSSTTTEAPSTAVYREPSTYEAMIRGELQAGNREVAEAVFSRMEERMYPVALYMRARAILDEPST